MVDLSTLSSDGCKPMIGMVDSLQCVDWVKPMNELQNVYKFPPDSARQLSRRLFSGSGLERVEFKKKSGRTLMQMKPNMTLGRSFPRMFRPVLAAYLLAGSTVLGLFGIQLEVEIRDE